jgi:hypothetical protein
VVKNDRGHSVILEKKDRLDAYLEKIFEEVYIPKAQNISKRPKLGYGQIWLR